MGKEGKPMNFNEELGQRLRQARKSSGWSLLEVEERTDGDFKASVLGAYERGERSLSALRLCQLADIYEVPAGSLLPTPYDGKTDGVVIDLDKAERLDGDQANAMQRFLNAIQTMRRDAQGIGLAVRQSDLHILNSFIDEVVDQPQNVFESEL